MRFSQSDRVAIGRLAYDPTATPAYDIIRSCLVWADERPVGISNDGYELVGDLWIYRGALHRGIPLQQWGVNPERFQSVWETALGDIPNWPGFRRIELSTDEHAFLVEELRKVATTRDY